MSKFLDTISFISSSGEEIEITKTPTPYKEAYSLISGSDTYQSLAKRGDNNNRFQASTPSGPLITTYAANKGYVDARYSEDLADKNTLAPKIAACEAAAVYKNKNDAQTISGETLYISPMSSELSFATKDHVDKHGVMSVEFLVSVGTGDFPNGDFAKNLSALIVDWGDQTPPDLWRGFSHTYSAGFYNNIRFYFTTRIGEKVFMNTKLIRIDIPDTVLYIGDLAFGYCNYLESVFVHNSTPPILDGDDVFNGTSDNLIIYVPSNSVNIYKQTAGWSNFSDKIRAIN